MKDFIFRFLAWILSVPLLVAAVFFALFNRDHVTVTFSPVHDALDFPLYLPVLIAAGVGVFFGALMTWAAGARQRAALRNARKEIKQLNARIDQISARTYNTPVETPYGDYHNKTTPTAYASSALLEKK